MIDVILERWSVAPEQDGTSIILPDGCCDVIIAHALGAAPVLRVSKLASHPHLVQIQADHTMSGYRLAPGSRIDTKALHALLHQADPDAEYRDEICECTSLDPLLSDAILSLSRSPSVEKAARQIGLSLRSLQRLFASHNLPAPVFWLQLARARQSAAALATTAPLAQIAYDHGYADQAHMHRAFKRFFASSPRKLKQRPDQLAQLFQPGLATGEQISTNVPSGSLT